MLCVAQDEQPQSNDIDLRQESSPDIAPSATGVAEFQYDIGNVPLPDGRITRPIGYVAKIFKAENHPWVVFHSPILMFHPKQGEPIEGYPPTVQQVVINSDGTTSLQFDIQMSTEHIKTKVLEELKSQSKETIDEWRSKTPDKKDKKIEVQKFPIKTAYIVCQHRVNHTILSRTIIPSLQDNVEGIAPVEFKFTPPALEMFKTAAKDDNIFFAPVYSYTGRFTRKNEIALQGSLNVDSELINDLTVEQMKGEDRLFQKYVNNLCARICQSVTTQVYAQNEQLAGMLLDSVRQNDILAKIFESGFVASSLELTPAEQNALVEYLLPQLKAWAKTEGQDRNISEEATQEVTFNETESESETKEKIKTKTIEAKVGGIAGPVAGGVGARMSETVRKTDEKGKVQQALDSWNKSNSKAEGMTLTLAENGTSIIPTNIRVYRRNTSVTNVDFQEFNMITIAGDATTALLSTSSVPLSLTVEKVNKQTKSNPYLPGVVTTTPGMMFPWVGTDETVPWGYVIPDGRESTNGLPNVFPEANWVPQKWWGKKIPDLTGYFMTTTKSLEEVLDTHEAAEYDHTHHAAVSGFQIPNKPVTVNSNGNITVSDVRVTSHNIGKILKDKLWVPLTTNKNYLKDMMSYRSAVLSAFCGWREPHYWEEKAFWDKNPQVGKTHEQGGKWVERRSGHTGSLIDVFVPSIIALSTRKGTKDGGNTNTEYTYAQVINDPAKIIEVMSWHWMLEEPWYAHDYFPANTTALGPKTTVTIPEIKIEDHKAPVVIDPDEERNKPSYFQTRLILRVL